MKGKTIRVTLTRWLSQGGDTRVSPPRLGVLVSVTLGVILLALLLGPPLRRFGWVEIGQQRFHVVYAITPQQRQRGLSGRERIGADGMLFVQPTATQSTFWMYDMQFPLDFVWIANNEVVDLHANVPAPQPGTPGTTPDQITRITPKQPVDMVIEFPSGTIDRENITIGTPVKRVLKWYYAWW